MEKSCGVVLFNETKVLLLQHPDGTKVGHWDFPKGHVEIGESELQTAVRELAEETGITDLRVFDEVIDLDIHEVNPPKEDRHHHYDARFLVLAPEGSVPVRNHESQELRWVEVESLHHLGVDSGVHRLARRCINQLTGL